MAKRRSQQQQQLVGPQKAAELLNIDRSTLHAAVKAGKITPDEYTPGGHSRFRLSTLEQYRLRMKLAQQGLPARVSDAIARASSALGQHTELTPVCEAIVRAALVVCPSQESVLLVTHDGAAPASAHMRVVLAHGLTGAFIGAYKGVWRRPGAGFAVLDAVYQGVPVISQDIGSANSPLPTPRGTARILREAGYRSYIAIPCRWAGHSAGALFCAGKEPHEYTSDEIAHLATLADIFTAALRRERRDENDRRLWATVTALQDAALELVRQQAADVAVDTRPLQQVIKLQGFAQMVVEWVGEGGAYGVAGDVDVSAEFIQAMRACAEARDDTEHVERKWVEASEPMIAVCARVNLPSGGHVVAGAAWRARDASSMEPALMRVYARMRALLVR